MTGNDPASKAKKAAEAKAKAAADAKAKAAAAAKAKAAAAAKAKASGMKQIAPGVIVDTNNATQMKNLKNAPKVDGKPVMLPVPKHEIKPLFKDGPNAAEYNRNQWISNYSGARAMGQGDGAARQVADKMAEKQGYDPRYVDSHMRNKIADNYKKGDAFGGDMFATGKPGYFSKAGVKRNFPK